MNITINNNEVILDGIKYIRKEEKKALQGIVKFEVGKWYITKERCELLRIDNIEGGIMYFQNGSEKYTQQEPYSCYLDYVRLATPIEIEIHLRKICDEKYIGKKVSVIENKITNERHPDPYVSQYDQYWMVDTKGRGVLVYENGKFAEIIPDKKPLPKTREEFKRYNTAWSEFWLKTPTGSKHDDNVVSFLDQYDFNE